MFNQEQQGSLFSAVPFAKIVGWVLIALALVMFGWVAFELYQLYKFGEAFLLMNKLIPGTILISTFEQNGNLYLPREILVYGIPMWILALTAQIGGSLLKAGSQYINRR